MYNGFLFYINYFYIMVQSPPKVAFNPKGKEHSDFSSIALTVSNLPYYVELRTGALIDFLQKIYKFSDRSLVQKWLNSRQRTGFMFEINKNLNLAFADQRDGKGKEYWWVLYFNDVGKRRIIENIKIQSHLVTSKIDNQKNKDDLTWNGLVFRSKTEIKIAKTLSAKNITFFANANGFITIHGLPISNQDKRDREKVEADFLIFHNHKWMILEVDGKHHNENYVRNWDYKRDRIFLRQGIPTVRFPASQCWENTSAVIDEFLEMFN